MAGTFWQYQGLTDFLFLVLGLCLLLLLPLLGLFSTFRNFLFKTKTSSQRAEDFELLLGRFMAPKIFSILVVLLNALLSAVLLFILLLKYDHFSWLINAREATALTCLFFLGVLFIIIWRRLIFAMWSALFIKKQEFLLLLRDYSLNAYIRLIFQIVVLFIAFLPLDKDILRYAFLGVLFTAVGIRSMSLFKHLGGQIGLWFSMFCYICACEVLPLTYLYLIGRYIYQHNYLVLLFEYL